MKLTAKASLQIQKPIEKVFEAIVNPEQITKYFISESSGRMETGKELIWDEVELHIRELEWKPQIWSSTPLYTREIHQVRIGWFNKFIEETPQISSEEIWKFHHIAGNGDKTMDLIMDRGVVHTKSITQVVKKEEVEFRYEDVFSI